jgi:hypothetical protein
MVRRLGDINVKARSKAVAALVASATAVAIWGGAAVLAAPPSTFTCSGTLASPEIVPAGNYHALSLPTGSFCVVAGPGLVQVTSPLSLSDGAGLLVVGGSLTVDGPLTVGPQAAFGAPTNSAPVSIRGPVRVGTDGAFILGTETPYAPDFAAIDGPVQSLNASTVQIHNTRVGGRVDLIGGGALNAIVDAVTGTSLDNNFNDLEDNQIGGPVREEGYQGVWAGVLRDVIAGPLSFTNNSEAPNIDEYDIGSDLIYGPATCSDNDPVPNTGDSPGAPSIVYGPVRGDQAATCTGIAGGLSGPPV